MKRLAQSFAALGNHRRWRLLVGCVVVMLVTTVAGISLGQRGQSRGQREASARPPTLRYFALVIGNNDYQHLKRLNTAVNDAREVARLLGEQFGFETRLLLNAGREQIIDALNDYRANLEEQDYLLIYYAGHGDFDRNIGTAYWQPVDARPNSNSRWISAADVTGNIKGIAAAHVLVISDSCYSGRLSRGDSLALLPAERQRFIEKMREGRSRMLIASGGNEPVADDGENNHSVFANALLRGLQRMENAEFTAGELFSTYILQAVAGKATQTPEYGVIVNSGHDSGDFVFRRRGAIANATNEAPRTSTQPPRQEHVEPQVYTETVNGVAIELVRIPAGKFLMGSPESEAGRDANEGPQHEVTISRPFYMGKYEVTQAQWRAVAQLPKVQMDLNAEPSHFKGDNLPVEQVSWEESVEFCERLSRHTGKSFRLPTEAEWEYACRAGTTGAYAGELDTMAWYGNNSGRQSINADEIWRTDQENYGRRLLENEAQAHTVGQKRANAWGLYDMHGNVWEWCQDWYAYYQQSSGIDPQGPNTGAERVRRGGSWNVIAVVCRSALRYGDTPDLLGVNIGFRYGGTPGFRDGNLGFRLAMTYGDAPEPAKPQQTRAADNSPQPADSLASGSVKRWELLGDKNLTVSANVAWTTTYMQVIAGQQIKVSSSNKQINLGSYGSAGPEGTYKDDPQRPLRDCQTGALIARVGEQLVCLGREATFTATVSGVLYLGINEGQTADNSGALVVNIKQYQLQ